MSLARLSAKLLIEFVTTKMTLEEYLAKDNKLSGNLSQPATDLTKDELAHEQCHATEWGKRNIGSGFYRDTKGYPFTAPNPEDFQKYITDNHVTKQQLKDLYLDVAKAPLEAGLELDGTDLKFYKILKGEIKTNHELAFFEIEHDLV